MTTARAKRHSSAPRRSGRPSGTQAPSAEPVGSATRIKRAAIDPAREREREAIEASIDAALRELDTLDSVPSRKKAPGRRVPPFPGTGRTEALPLLPSMRPTRSSAPKKGR